MQAAGPFVVTFANTLPDTCRALEAATDFLKRAACFKPEVELVLAEAMNNIVDHAYVRRGTARLEIAADQAGLRCILRDSGDAYCPDQATSQAVDTPRGRGWAIIRGLCDQVSLRRLGRTNHLEFHFPR